MDYLNTVEFQKQTGLTTKVLYYWIEHDVIRPAEPHFGSGGYGHRYSAENIFQAKVLLKLRVMLDKPDILVAARRALEKRKANHDCLVILSLGVAYTDKLEHVVDTLIPNAVTTLVRMDDL